MAFYQDIKDLEISGDPIFDKIIGPGDTAPASGIYRCEGCGGEDVSTRGILCPLKISISIQRVTGL